MPPSSAFPIQCYVVCMFQLFDNIQNVKQNKLQHIQNYALFSSKPKYIADSIDTALLASKLILFTIVT